MCRSGLGVGVKYCLLRKAAMKADAVKALDCDRKGKLFLVVRQLKWKGGDQARWKMKLPLHWLDPVSIIIIIIYYYYYY